MRTRGHVPKGTGPKEVVMADNRDPLEKERDVLVTCVEEAYEALRLLPGLDANGSAVVWLADQLLQIRRRYQSAG
jgi:hypothetical protein